jgi:hypothetical protein
MLSECELIDTENTILLSQYMKFVGEWGERTSHKLNILSSRLILFTINHIHIQMTCLPSLNQGYKWIYGTFISFNICIFSGMSYYLFRFDNECTHMCYWYHYVYHAVFYITMSDLMINAHICLTDNTTYIMLYVKSLCLI